MSIVEPTTADEAALDILARGDVVMLTAERSAASGVKASAIGRTGRALATGAGPDLSSALRSLWNILDAA